MFRVLLCVVLTLSLGCSGRKRLNDTNVSEEQNNQFVLSSPKEQSKEIALKEEVPNINTEQVRKVRTFSEVTKRIFANNPILKSYSHRIASANSLIEQANLVPNPEFEVELEEFGGDASGLRETETSISIVQPLELGGKRATRTELAKAEKELRTLESRILVSETLTEAQLAFNSAIFAKAIVEILEGQVKLSKEVVDAIQKKLTAGSIMPVEKTKAEITLQNDILSLQSAKKELSIARHSLATLWNGTELDVGSLGHQLKFKQAYDYLIPYEIKDSPYYQHAMVKTEVAGNKVAVEKSLAVPDASFGLGYKRFEETNSNTFLGVFSIGLPVFNRNQGAIQSARQELSISNFERKNVGLRLQRKLRSTQTRLKKLLNEYDNIQGTILPSAEKAFEQAKTAYQRGRSSYIELLDAQRTLVETRLRKHEVLLSVNENQANITNIMGFNFPSFQEMESE